MVIEGLDGNGAIRIPGEVLQELGVDVGDSLCLIEEYVGTARCLVLSICTNYRCPPNPCTTSLRSGFSTAHRFKPAGGALPMRSVIVLTTNEPGFAASSSGPKSFIRTSKTEIASCSEPCE